VSAAKPITGNVQDILKQVIGGNKIKLVGGKIVVQDKVVIFSLDETNTLKVGFYCLLALGDDVVIKEMKIYIPAIKAKDDESHLDGNYDEQAGGHFMLPFQVKKG
jgi:hypothetical protein